MDVKEELITHLYSIGSIRWYFIAQTWYDELVHVYPGDEPDVKKYWTNVATKTTKYTAVNLQIPTFKLKIKMYVKI